MKTELEEAQEKIKKHETLINIRNSEISQLKDQVWSVDKYLDDLNLPTQDEKGEIYSSVGRIKQLEKRMLGELSEIETKYLRKEVRQKMYRVTLRGMTYNSTGIAYGVSYVVAENSDDAYKKVRTFINSNDLGFSKDRELDKVELIADTYQYNDVGTILYL